MIVLSAYLKLDHADAAFCIGFYYLLDGTYNLKVLAERKP